MSDPFRKVQSGSPLQIPAEAYNAFIDAARDHRQRSSQIGRQSLPQSPAETILIRNASGEDRERFDVLGISAPTILPQDNEQQFSNQVALNGNMPMNPHHSGRFVILAEPLAAGRIGRAFISGVTVARLRIDQQWQGQQVRFADVINEDAAALEPAAGGSVGVLWHEHSQLGDVWSVVRLGNEATSRPPSLFKIIGGGGGGIYSCRRHRRVIVDHVVETEEADSQQVAIWNVTDTGIATSQQGVLASGDYLIGWQDGDGNWIGFSPHYSYWHA